MIERPRPQRPTPSARPPRAIQRSAKIKPRRPTRDDTQAPSNPLAGLKPGDDLEGEAREEFDRIKASLQKQDKQQREQFKNLYSTAYYYVDCFATEAESDRTRAIQNRILGIDGHDDMTSAYRDGHVLAQAWDQLAQRLDVDVSDL